MIIPSRYLIGLSVTPLIIPGSMFAFERQLDDAVLVAFLTSYLAMGGIGAPCIIWLYKIKQLNMVNLCLCGAAGGIVAWFVFVIIFRFLFDIVYLLLTDQIYSMLIAGFMGFVVALVFGLISGVPMSEATEYDT